MDFKALFPMRPKGESVKDIDEALQLARNAGEAARASIGDIQARRAAVLLNGSEQEVASAEAALAAARADAERSDVLVPALEQKLAEAQRRERIAALVVQVAEANAKCAAAEKAIHARYEELAHALVRDVLQPENEAIRAREAAALAVDRLVQDLRLDEIPENLRVRKVPFGVQMPNTLFRNQLGDEIRLPSLKGTGFPNDHVAAIWPPHNGHRQGG
ncbi:MULTISPECIES: hypothetical protein [Roseomonadaceae]|uniref:Uncharacterized protein n=1 Tax=Falsiroseomonas oleicola TaxID=2801474 RepID=A0ABS6H6K3_9PROT|nr:hypothetical protein [Roseomonas oleicola]MBU8544325.1 hypothetical protein [Roseomonas oleicola]